MNVWDACTMEPCPLFRWIECHPGTAGWLQAVGTIAAIATAVILSRSDASARRKDLVNERMQRAVAVAARVIPFLVQTSNRLDEIDVLNATGDYGLEMAMFDMGNTITRYSISPLADRQLLDQISALTVAQIRNFMMLVALTDEYNPYIIGAMPMARSMDANDRGNYQADMKRKLDAIRMLTRQLLPEMNELLKIPDLKS